MIDLYVGDFARVAQVIDTGSHVLSPRNISLKTCVFLQLAEVHNWHRWHITKYQVEMTVGTISVIYTFHNQPLDPCI